MRLTWWPPVAPILRCDTDTPWLARKPLNPQRFIPPWKPFPILVFLLGMVTLYRTWGRTISLQHRRIDPERNESRKESCLCDHPIINLAIIWRDLQVYSPTGTWASGVTGNSFTMYLEGTPDFSKWPRIAFVVVLSGLSDAATCTAWYSVLSWRTVFTFAVTWQFSSFSNVKC